MPLPKLYGLALAGGQGRRMGQEKAWLEIKGESLAMRACRSLSNVCDKVFLSVRKSQFEKASRLDGIEQQGIEILIDELEEIGPAAALLKAYDRDQEAAWFVFACDFVLANQRAFSELKSIFVNTKKSPFAELSCYKNSDQFDEPLFAIWTPAALRELRKNVGQHMTGPSFTLNSFSHLTLVPHRPEILMNANDPKSWMAISKILNNETD